MKSFCLCLFLFFLAYGEVFGQDIPSLVQQAYALVEEEKYKEGLKILLDIDEQDIDAQDNSCAMMYYYERGSCLYFLDRFEEAIPCLNKALLRMEKLPRKDCLYLELFYGIGSCYSNLKQYIEAEKFFRRGVTKGNILGLNCSITTQTLSELSEVYYALGYTKFASDCSAKINSNVNVLPEDSWLNRVDLLLDLADSYEVQNKFDDEIETYNKILQLIDSNIGKDNEDYLTYSSLFFQRLLLINRTDDAISVLKQMIDVGNRLNNNNILVCDAYENFLELSAKKNDVETVDKNLPSAVKYILHTKEYDWQNHNLYEIIGNAFFEAGNDSCGRQYLEKLWNDQLPHTIRSLSNLGFYYFDKNPQKSLSYFKETESLISDSTNLVTKKVIYNHIFALYSKLKQFDEAIQYAQIVAPYIKKIDGNDLYSSHLISWAMVLVGNKQPKRAFVLFKEVNDHLPELSNRTKMLYYSQYGYASLGNTNYTEAIKALENGITISIETYGENNVFLTTMYHNLGRAYMLIHDYNKALQYLNKSKDLQIKLNGKAMQRTLDYIKECESK